MISPIQTNLWSKAAFLSLALPLFLSLASFSTGEDPEDEGSCRGCKKDYKITYDGDSGCGISISTVGIVPAMTGGSCDDPAIPNEPCSPHHCKIKNGSVEFKNNTQRVVSFKDSEDGPGTVDIPAQGKRTVVFKDRDAPIDPDGDEVIKCGENRLLTFSIICGENERKSKFYKWSCSACNRSNDEAPPE